MRHLLLRLVLSSLATGAYVGLSSQPHQDIYYKISQYAQMSFRCNCKTKLNSSVFALNAKQLIEIKSYYDKGNANQIL